MPTGKLSRPGRRRGSFPRPCFMAPIGHPTLRVIAFGHAGQDVSEQYSDPSFKARAQAVINPAAPALGFNHPGSPQHAHVMGDQRLLSADAAHELADAVGALIQQHQDAQASRVGDRLQENERGSRGSGSCPGGCGVRSQGHWTTPWAQRQPPQVGKVFP